MYLNFYRFHRLRLLTAIVVLVLALLYLAELQVAALTGFALITLVVIFICNALRKGTMPAVCDLCLAKGTMKAEYGPGFSNARLVIRCPRCGRVINHERYGIDPQKE